MQTCSQPFGKSALSHAARSGYPDHYNTGSLNSVKSIYATSRTPMFLGTRRLYFAIRYYSRLYYLSMFVLLCVASTRIKIKTRWIPKTHR